MHRPEFVGLVTGLVTRLVNGVQLERKISCLNFVKLAKKERNILLKFPQKLTEQ